jgi:hypothetical protein
MMIGIGTPINHNNAPLPKPMTTSCPMTSEETRAATIGSNPHGIGKAIASDPEDYSTK